MLPSTKLVEKGDHMFQIVVDGQKAARNECGLAGAVADVLVSVKKHKESLSQAYMDQLANELLKKQSSYEFGSARKSASLLKKQISQMLQQTSHRKSLKVRPMLKDLV